MNITQKLQSILNSKSDIKAAIEKMGITVGDASFNEYASMIDKIDADEFDGENGTLSVESRTIATSSSATANIVYNKNCGIIDENNILWDTIMWHSRWVKNGYSATGLSKPIGIWMHAFGMDLYYLWNFVWGGSSDTTGTSAISKNFSMFLYNQKPITAATAADRTVWPCNVSGNIGHGTAGKYKSATWRSVNNGDGLDMVCDNTLETFTIPNRNVGNASAFVKDNYEDYMESYYQQCEFCKALFAICSGIETTENSGTTTTVDILNSNGQQAAVNEDMYFWINGTNTGLLAKYNINSIPVSTANSTSALLPQATADAIYNKQKANGVNMNDTGVNSTTKPVIPLGGKGAEAIAVDGYWYIKTPYISSPNASSFIRTANVQNAQAPYACKHFGVTMYNDRRLYPYYLNKSTHISSIVNLLRTTEGLTADVPDVISESVWSAIRCSEIYGTSISTLSGVINPNQTINQVAQILPSPLSSTVFKKQVEVKYLTGNGNQYITLPVNVNAGEFFEVSGNIEVKNAGQTTATGVYIYTNGAQGYSNNSQFQVTYYSANTTNGSSIVASMIGEDPENGGIDFKGGVFNEFAVSTEGKTINGTFYTLERPLTAPLTSITLSFKSTVKFNSIKIKAGNTLLYDLKAVRIGTTGFMQDQLTGTYYENNGSGDFIIGPDSPSNLLYWWDSSDELLYESSYYWWVDKVQGARCRALNPNKVDGMFELQAKDYTPERTFTFATTSLNAGNAQIVIPAAWKIVVECMFPSGITATNNSVWPFDFGSLTQSTHAFGVSYNTTTNIITINYKPIGNNGNSLYGIASNNRPVVATDELITFEYGTEYVNSSQVQLYVKYNGTKAYGIAPHADYAYNGNWNVQYGYFGKGFVSGYYGGKCYLKSIKIYDNTQTVYTPPQDMLER